MLQDEASELAHHSRGSPAPQTPTLVEWLAPGKFRRASLNLIGGIDTVLLQAEDRIRLLDPNSRLNPLQVSQWMFKQLLIMPDTAAVVLKVLIDLMKSEQDMVLTHWRAGVAETS